MKFFETPIMNISMFESENVVTEPSNTVPAANTVAEAESVLSTAIGAAEVSEGNTFTFTF